MKDKSININIHNTNILKKDKKRKRKRRTNTKKYNKKEVVSVGQPTQYRNQSVVTSTPSYIPPKTDNKEAMTSAVDYLAPKTNRNNLLLTNGEPETNKDRNNLSDVVSVNAKVVFKVTRLLIASYVEVI